MRPMHALLPTALLVAALAPAVACADEAAPAVTVPSFANATCPIMGKPASLKLFVDTEMGRMYVCCPPCMAKIKKDVATAYKVAYPTTKKAGNTVCPVTGKPLDDKAVTILLQGYEIGLSSADVIAAARADSQITLVKATNPKVVNVGDRTCPINGQPVVANAFALVGNDLIRLSSPGAVEEVRKDPAKALKTAKDLAAAQAAHTAPTK